MKILVIKTDHLGDQIIWSRGFADLKRPLRVVARNVLPGLEDVTLVFDARRALVDPAYLLAIARALPSHAEVVLLPCASKTPDMVALAALFPAERVVTLADSNSNTMSMRWLEKHLAGRRIGSLGTEYLDVDSFFRLAGAAHAPRPLSMKGHRVLFSPFASGAYKELTDLQVAQALRYLERQGASEVVVIGVSARRLPAISESYGFKLRNEVNATSLADLPALMAPRAQTPQIFFGMDSAVFHTAFALNCASHYFVISGLGYPFRFAPASPQVSLVTKNCSYAGCRWRCRMPTQVCVKEIDFTRTEEFVFPVR